MKYFIVYNNGNLFENITVLNKTYNTLIHSTLTNTGIFNGITQTYIQDNVPLYIFLEKGYTKVWAIVDDDNPEMKYNKGYFIGPSDYPGIAEFQHDEDRMVGLIRTINRRCLHT